MIKKTKTLNIKAYSTVMDYFLDVHQIPRIIPFIEFLIEFQSNNLIYHREYTKRQQIIYALIKLLHDEEGLGYRKILLWLNKSEIKT